MANKQNQADSYIYGTLEILPLLFETYEKTEVVKSPEFEIKMIGQDSKLLSTKWYLEFSPAYTDSICAVLFWHSSESEVTVGARGTIKFSWGIELTEKSVPFDISKQGCGSEMIFFGSGKG